MAGLMSRTIADRQGEVLEAAQPGGESDRDARLLVRADARAAPERQARRRRRRHCEEAARAPDAEARAERRQARDAGAPGSRCESRRSRAAGARAQGGRAAAAPGTRRAGAAARRTSRRSSSRRSRRSRRASSAFRSTKEVLKAQYSAAEAQVHVGEAATGIGTRHGRHRAASPAREGQDRGAAGARVGDRRADEQRARSRIYTAGDQTQLDRELAQISATSPGRQRSSRS